MALNVKKGDNVLVIAGKDKGKTGKVLVAMPADNSVVVAGVNIIAKHKKPRSANDKGGIIKRENKIDASNVQIVCPACNKATRVSYAIENGEKHRQCKKCGANLDVAVKKETKKITSAKKAETTKDTTKTTTKKAEAKVENTEAKATKTATKAAPKAEAKKETTTKTTAKKSTTKKVESK